MLPHMHSSEPQHSANPDTPPPEYSVLVHQEGPLSSQPSQHSLEQSLFSPSSAGPQFAPPSPFGPTPLTMQSQTLGLLPYYDPHSPYSIEAATFRARWRFVGSAFWAIGLIACLFLLGALKGLQTL